MESLLSRNEEATSFNSLDVEVKDDTFAVTWQLIAS